METKHQSNVPSEVELAKAQLEERLHGHRSVCGIGEGEMRNGKVTLMVFLSEEAPELERDIKEIAGHEVSYFVSGIVTKLSAATWDEVSMPTPEVDTNQ